MKAFDRLPQMFRLLKGNGDADGSAESLNSKFKIHGLGVSLHWVKLNHLFFSKGEKSLYTHKDIHIHTYINYIYTHIYAHICFED